MNMWSILERIAGKRLFMDSKKKAIISFTFDDAPVSSFTMGGKILEDNGFRGTYYIAAELLERLTEIGQIAGLKTITEFRKRGHEIANHTYGHINCEKSGPVRVIRSIQENRKMLDGIVSSNFSYPFGAIDSQARFATRLCSTSARGISPGINRGIINLMDLKAVRIYSRSGIDRCLGLVRECAALGGWLIFYTHDVCDSPSDFGCTPEQFREVVAAASNRKISVLTVQKAMEIL
ncbi:MAG: hypothetical protein A2277_18050 [Desulfobacterales bacterium RIFOXYA12_FULL_46_15]|nr:MAG: hypothetical protein A2097_00135 [Desulfobacula sp. GWF2_41_7]OGR25527.1 MAG: hypothetical protein A2277_18050 [Desulfobacterales bacterium RIFOXYA12_FULL_46_15]